MNRRDTRVAIVGVGGLGCPVALALARAGVGTLVLIDDDVVDATNLHRQILFRAADVGRHKLDAAKDALALVDPAVRVELRKERLRPGAERLIADADVIVECSDRYAVKLLAADFANALAKPIVHGAAIRWIGTAFSCGGAGAPCYRCLFEDVPEGAQGSCDVSGVVGPVCGVIGALQADLALSVIDGRPRAGTLVSFDGRTERFRARTIARRSGCPSCGTARGADRIEPTHAAETRA